VKINRDPNGQLEIVNSSFLLPSGLIILGGGMFCQELLKFIRGEQHLTDFKSDFPIAVGALFFIVGLALLCRYSARFDRLQQRMTWKRAGLFGVKTRVVSFADINHAGLEVDPNRSADYHPKKGPMVRLIVVTMEEVLPLAGMYTYQDPSMGKARDAINEFLGRTAEQAALSSETNLQALVAQGRLIAAIKLVQEKRNCGLAEAKQIVDDMAKGR